MTSVINGTRYDLRTLLYCTRQPTTTKSHTILHCNNWVEEMFFVCVFVNNIGMYIQYMYLYTFEHSWIPELHKWSTMGEKTNNKHRWNWHKSSSYIVCYVPFFLSLLSICSLGKFAETGRQTGNQQPMECWKEMRVEVHILFLLLNLHTILTWVSLIYLQTLNFTIWKTILYLSPKERTI